MAGSSGIAAALLAGLLISSSARAAAPFRCGTPDLHPRAPGPASAALRARIGLPPLPGPASFAAGGYCPTRPVYGNTMDSASLPLRVHYETAHAAMAVKVLGWMETSWTFEQAAPPAGLGFLAPAPDGDGIMDVFLEPSAYGGYYCPEAYVANGLVATSGWISINPELDDDLFTKAAVAHELHHAIQFGIDANEDPSFMEMTSAYVMEQVFDEADAAAGFIYTFQESPHFPLDYFSYGEPYQYGASLFLFWLLDDLYGVNGYDALHYLWVASAEQWDGSGDPPPNEPDYFDALSTLLAASDLTLDEAYVGFAQDRWFTGASHDGTFEEGATYREPGVARSLDAGGLPAGMVNVPGGVSEYGVAYLRVDLDEPSGEATLDVAWDAAAGKSWTVVLLRPDAPGSQDRTVLGSGAAGSATLSGLSALSEVILGFVNTGDGAHDPDDDDWASSAVGVTLAYHDPRGGPGDEDGEGPVACGCSLSSRGRPRVVGLAVILGAARLLAARRRRGPPCA